MQTYLQLASGGKLTLASGGSLLLSGPLYRTATAAEGQGMSFNGVATSLGQALVQAGFSEADVQGLPVSLYALFNLLLEANQVDAESFDGLSQGQAEANAIAAEASAQAEAALAAMQGQGLVSKNLTATGLQAIAFEAISQVQGMANSPTFVAETQGEARIAAAIAFGVATFEALQANSDAEALDADMFGVGVVNRIAEYITVIAQAYQSSSFGSGVVVTEQQQTALAEILTLKVRTLRDGVYVRFVPDAPTQLNLVRNEAENSITLTWQESSNTQSIIVQRSLGDAREDMSDHQVVAKGVRIFSEAVPTDRTVSYRLIAVGETNLKSVPSAIVYSTPTSEIF